MSKPALKPKPTREQIITARRIVFRRNLKNNEQPNNIATEPQYSIQQVRNEKEMHKNYSHFVAKTDKMSGKDSENNQQLHWSRCKEKAPINSDNSMSQQDEDFRAYQNGNLNEFFDGNANRRISDVCLMNDHFILVKLPPPEGRQTASEVECIVKHVEHRPCLPQTQAEQRMNSHKQHNRRVQPMESAIVGIQTVKEFKPISKVPNALRHIHWKKDLEEESEIFESHTQIKKVFRRDSPMPKSILNKISTDSSNAKTESSIRDLVLNEKFSPYQDVEMQNQGALVCLEDNEQPDPAQLKIWEDQQNKKRPALRAFQWLINPFCLRLRRRKRPKPKPKIQAVIYKTYFMRWTKPTDVDWCKSNEYNKQHSNGFNSKKLRRIRSALF